MALLKPVPSRATRKAFQAGMAELIEFGRVPRDRPTEDYPQQIYTLSLPELADGADVGTAKPVMWQFLMSSASGVALAADVAHPPKGKRPRLTSVMQGPAVAKAIKAIEHVERLPQVQARDYELRRLFIAGLSIRAFWLKSVKGDRDLVVPFHAAAKEFQRMKTYPKGKFMTIVRRLAKARLKFDDRPKQT